MASRNYDITVSRYVIDMDWIPYSSFCLGQPSSTCNFNPSSACFPFMYCGTVFFSKMTINVSKTYEVLEGRHQNPIEYIHLKKNCATRITEGVLSAN